MHFLFIDESGTPPKPEQRDPKPYFIIAGVTVPEGQWQAISQEFSQLKREKKFRVKGEIKWRYFGPSNRDPANSISHLSTTEKDEFREQFFAILTKRNSVKIICCVASVSACYSKAYITTDELLYQYTYKPVSERFQYYLQDLSRIAGSAQLGIIVADHRGRKQDEALRHHHQRLLGQANMNMAQYNNILETIFLTPSHLSVGIQFADMVAGAIGRRFNSNQQGADKFYNLIAGSFRKNPNTGAHEGYGLVRFPADGWG
jgi:hypothetical protein